MYSLEWKTDYSRDTKRSGERERERDTFILFLSTKLVPNKFLQSTLLSGIFLWDIRNPFDARIFPDLFPFTLTGPGIRILATQNFKDPFLQALTTVIRGFKS